MAAQPFSIDTSRRVALLPITVAKPTGMRSSLAASMSAEQARAVNAALVALNAALAA